MENEDRKKGVGDRTVIIQDEGLNRFRGGFTAFPNAILRNGKISIGARMTYGMLLSYGWQKDFCYPAQEQLAEDLGISDRSVRTFLKELKELGIVSWKQQGLNRPNIYFIHTFPAVEGETDEKKTLEIRGPEKFSGPDRKYISGQDRKQASDKEYSMNKKNNVNVGFVKKEENDNEEEDDKTDPEAYLLSEIVRHTGDTNPKSLGSFRIVIRKLKHGTAERILVATKEAHAAGKVPANKRAGYFIGMAKNIAKERGIDLGFRNGADRVLAGVADLKAKIGNTRAVREWKSEHDDRE